MTKGLRATGDENSKERLKSGFRGRACCYARATASAAERPGCSGGLELRLTAPQASQGSLILARNKQQEPLREVTGKWGDRSVYFWKVEHAYGGVARRFQR